MITPNPNCNTPIYTPNLGVGIVISGQTRSSAIKPDTSPFPKELEDYEETGTFSKPSH